jgi:hypothetical protein
MVGIVDGACDMNLFAATYLANKPTGGVLVCLIVAVVLFVVAALGAAYWKAFWATVLAAGLAFLTLAFLIS